MIAASFLACLLGFVLVGVASSRFARRDRRNYLLADQDVAPWLVGLSAVATNNSGYMFIGVVGYTWVTGLPATWLMAGWLLGDLCASQVVHRRLRDASTTAAGDTFPALLAAWGGQHMPLLRRVGGLVTLVFLGTYAAAQLTAGSKALQVMFGWADWVGATVGAAIVLVYCLAGGIRASIWTDAAQSMVMIVAMLLLFATAITALGGPTAAWAALHAVDPAYMDPLPRGVWPDDTWGPLLFVLGWFFAGASVVGQPHVMVRFMALDDPARTNRARAWYYAWFAAFYLVTNAVAMLSRALLPETAGFDPELALPTLALELLPAVLVGLVLAGVFAATMSTADSLVLACAGSLTEDVLQTPRGVLMAKLATLAVTGFALWLALTGDQGVFALVISSWAVLGASFGPLVVVLALGQRPSQGLALAMLLTGLGTVYLWQAVGLPGIYEGLPAVLAGFAVFGIGRGLGQVKPIAAAAPAGPAG